MFANLAVMILVKYTWIDNVQCVGNESSIGQCQFRRWGIHICSHQEDIGA